MDRYEEIIKREQNRLQTNKMIYITMLVIGAIILVFGKWLGALLIIMGAVLAYGTKKRREKLRWEVGKISNPEVFAHEMEEARIFDSFFLILTEQYAIVERPELKIYPFSDMAKFEVGLAGDKQKALFLTGKNGVRNKIAETNAGDGRQADFDQAYNIVRSRFS